MDGIGLLSRITNESMKKRMDGLVALHWIWILRSGVALSKLILQDLSFALKLAPSRWYKKVMEDL